MVAVNTIGRHGGPEECALVIGWIYPPMSCAQLQNKGCAQDHRNCSLTSLDTHVQDSFPSFRMRVTVAERAP